MLKLTGAGTLHSKERAFERNMVPSVKQDRLRDCQMLLNTIIVRFIVPRWARPGVMLIQIISLLAYLKLHRP